ncbi:MAG: hypothetical protein ACUVRA_05495 [Candidatus Bathyarchaeaceae archaeon]
MLMLVGGIVLAVGLIAPWYYRTEGENHYSMSAMGGSLTDDFGSEFFNPLTAYISLCFALVSIVFPFVSAKFSEATQRKYVAIVSCFAGICALMNIMYIHSWLSWAYPETPFICYDPEVSCSPQIGYFLTWAAMVLLFASTYFSKGLTQTPAKAECQKASQKLFAR